VLARDWLDRASSATLRGKFAHGLCYGVIGAAVAARPAACRLQQDERCWWGVWSQEKMLTASAHHMVDGFRRRRPGVGMDLGFSAGGEALPGAGVQGYADAVAGDAEVGVLGMDGEDLPGPGGRSRRWGLLPRTRSPPGSRRAGLLAGRDGPSLAICAVASAGSEATGFRCAAHSPGTSLQAPVRVGLLYPGPAR
jgi:hypothetical protein